MATLVLTVIGDDQSGLVDALSGVIADHGGNWQRSHMTQLAGKFAGIVEVSVPDHRVDELTAELEPLELRGLLEITVERAEREPSSPPGHHAKIGVVGLDRRGLVHEVAHALAARGVSIVDLQTETESAAMAGGTLFKCEAVVELPDTLSSSQLDELLHDLSDELVVDIELRDVDD